MKKRARSNTNNQLAVALREVLDDSGLMTRREWASLLGITPAAISLWVTGRTLPRADHLSAVWDFVVSSSGIPESVTDTFRRVASLPARKATPFFKRLRGEPTIAHYMLRPLREAMFGTLASLDPSVQEELLYRTAELGRKLSTESASVATRLASVPWMLEPGTKVSEFPELSDLFKVHWKNIAVFGWTPRDGSNGFFRRVAVDLLTRFTPHDFNLYYGVPRSSSFRDELEHVLSTLSTPMRHRATERIKLLEVQETTIEQLLSGLPPGHPKAELLVALDLGEETQCGYAWYKDGFGVVLERSATIAIDRAIAYPSSDTILRFPGPPRPAEPADLPPASLNLERAQ